MMMNIRGLIFDDPNGTKDLEIPTLVFNASIHAQDD